MRRLAAAVTAALLLGAVPASADPTPSPTQVPEDAIKVLVTSLLPRAPEPGSSFQVQGQLINQGSAPITDVRVQLAVGDVVQSRGGLQSGDRDRPDTGRRTVTRTLEGTLAPGGGTLGFDLRTTIADLGLSELGVYPLDVRAYGRVGDEGRSLLGLAPTWVPYFARTNPQRNKVAVLWPLVDKPRQAPSGRFLDDDLAGSLSETGRLGRLLLAAKDAGNPVCAAGPKTPRGIQTQGEQRCESVPVTFGVDPDLISAVDLMANAEKYQVGTSSKTSEGKGKAAAVEWLSGTGRLKGLKEQIRSGNGSVLALPYADPDVVALARTAAGREDITAAVRLGNQVVAGALSATPVDATWPPSGVVTSDAALALAPTRGTTAFVLDETAFPDPDSAPARTPSAFTDITFQGQRFSALVADDVMSRLLVARDTQSLGARLVEQRFIAETAIVAAEAQALSRTFLLVPPRDSDPGRQAAGEMLRDLGRLPWLCPVRLEDLALGSESCAAPRNDAESARIDAEKPFWTTPRTRNPVELPPTYLSGVLRDRDAAHQLTTSVLDTDVQDAAPAITALGTRMRQAVARAESTAWRDDPTSGTRMAQLLTDEVTRLTQSVQLLAGKRLLLTSNKGTLQVSIANSLDLPVRVQVRFTFPALKPVSTGLVTVAGKRSVPASVKAEAQRSGQFLVLAQIYDRDGKPFGTQTQVLVRSTRYGRLALGLTIAAAGILLVAAGVRITRRALRSGRETE